MSLLSVSTVATSTSFEAVREGGVTVDLDASLVVQIVILVALAIILKPLLFDPMMKLFEEREKRTEGTRRRATKEDERSAKALAEYEAILAKARAAGNAERDALRAEGVKKEAQLLADVRTTAGTTIEQGRAAIATELQTARQQLRQEASVLGRQIAKSVLGREVSS